MNSKAPFVSHGLKTGHAHNHLVRFYEDEDYLTESLVDFIGDGLTRGDSCIVIATPDHIRSLHTALKKQGIAYAPARKNGSYIVLDAAETLSTFMRDGLPDWKLFKQNVGAVVKQAAQRGAPVRAFGEMVAILWSEANKEAVYQLEEYWNDLNNYYEFELHCAYPLSGFDKSVHQAVMDEINRRHSTVVPAESYSRLTAAQDQMKAITLLQQRSEVLKSELENSRTQLVLNAGKEEFMAIATHQLRSPATGVKQYLGLLLNGFLGELSTEQHQVLEQAYRCNERQFRIINDLLLSAKIDADAVEIAKQDCNLVQLVWDVAGEHQDEIAQRGQNAELALPREMNIQADPSYILMAIENLFTNASKYSASGRTITVTVHKQDGDAVIDVKDEGIGISKLDQAKLFKKFSRIPNKFSTSTSGTGLGLYWVKKIVELHGGRITVVSAPAKGSTFTIRLPLR